jgi:hypothetical protein
MRGIQSREQVHECSNGRPVKSVTLKGRLEVGCFKVDMIELRAQAHRCNGAVHLRGDE